jgi:hypothetical protein
MFTRSERGGSSLGLGAGTDAVGDSDFSDADGDWLEEDWFVFCAVRVTAHMSTRKRMPDRN